ncbi:hypothetical protein NPIL_135381, partial [Nephila pilipes]
DLFLNICKQINL